MNSIKTILILLVSNFVFLLSFETNAKNDYCSYNVDNLESNVIIIDTLSLLSQNGDYNKDALSVFQSGFDSIKDNTNLGQKLIIYKYTKDGNPQRIFDSCNPGCPNTSVLERIVGGVCSKGEAISDINKYVKDSNIAVAIAIRDAKKSLIKTNNIISKISSLSNELKQYSPNDNIYIFSNLLENSSYGNFNEIDENIFHIAFVKAVSNNLIPENYSDNIVIYGVKSSKLVTDFWDDLFMVSNSKPKLMPNLLD